MATYPRPITEIHQIEITTRCNLACRYCPHPKMQRPKVDMDRDVYSWAIDWAAYYARNGTQKELSFTGIGEATLHPRFIDYMADARLMMPDVSLLFSTNGMPSFTDDIARACAEYDVGVYVSLHRPEVAGKAIELAKKYKVLRGMNSGAATSAVDWAGTVEWFVSAPKQICAHLQQGWGVVLVDGSITTCCFDSENLGIIGHVKDRPSASLKTKPYSLCDKCYQVVP